MNCDEELTGMYDPKAPPPKTNVKDSKPKEAKRESEPLNKETLVVNPK